MARPPRRNSSRSDTRLLSQAAVASLAPYLRNLDPRLPRAVWTLEAGTLANSFGTGLAYPFLLIYLHNVRGFSLGTAGLVVAVIGGVAVVGSPACGPLVDRIGARPTLAGSLVLLAAGYGLFPL